MIRALPQKRVQMQQQPLWQCRAARLIAAHSPGKFVRTADWQTDWQLAECVPSGAFISPFHGAQQTAQATKNYTFANMWHKYQDDDDDDDEAWPMVRADVPESPRRSSCARDLYQHVMLKSSLATSSSGRQSHRAADKAKPRSEPSHIAHIMIINMQPKRKLPRRALTCLTAKQHAATSSSSSSYSYSFNSNSNSSFNCSSSFSS